MNWCWVCLMIEVCRIMHWLLWCSVERLALRVEGRLRLHLLLMRLKVIINPFHLLKRVVGDAVLVLELWLLIACRGLYILGKYSLAWLV